MKKLTIVLVLLIGLVAPGPVLGQVKVDPAAEKIITDGRVRQDEGFVEAQIQQFLDKQPGPLKSYSETPPFGSVQSAARSIAGAPSPSPMWVGNQ